MKVVARSALAPAFFFFLEGALAPTASAQQSFFLVDTAQDLLTNELTPCASIDVMDCSLRDALMIAESGDTIQFSSVVFPAAPLNPIMVKAELGPLPDIVQGMLTIEGDLQKVIIDGKDALAGSDGLTIKSNANTLYGITVRNFGGDGIVLDGGANNVLGTCQSGPRKNRIASNGGHGLRVTGEGADNNQILSNEIGGSDAGNGLGGILIDNGPDDTTIGCASYNDPIVIANNAGNGVALLGPGTTNVTFRGAKITGSRWPDGHGIFVDGATNVSDADADYQPILITGNQGDGIRVVTGSQIRFYLRQTFDSIKSVVDQNDGLAFNLVAPGDPDNGVTGNDAGDVDTGPNGLLNFPIVSALTPKGGGIVTVKGTACAGCDRGPLVAT